MGYGRQGWGHVKVAFDIHVQVAVVVVVLVVVLH